MSGPPKPAWHAAMDEPSGEPRTGAAEPGAAESCQHDAEYLARRAHALLSSSVRELAIVEAAPASAASAAEPSDNLLLRSADLTGLRQRSQNIKNLHDQARDFLNAKIQAFSPHQEGRVQSQPVDTNDWSTWKEYVASHAAADSIIGTQGIKAIHIEQIDGVKDPNRGGQRRVDIVVYNADGQFFRLHPGSKPKNDAQLKQGNWSVLAASEPNAESSGAAEPRVTDTGSIGSASRQYHEPPPVLTREVAEQIPQNHCIGRRELFSKLQGLSRAYPLELTHATLDVFPWWLWIPNTGTVRDEVIGCGIERIALVETTTDEHTHAITSARFLIVHTDQTALLLSASDGTGRRTPYHIETLVHGSRNYNWWVNWRP